MTGKPHFFSLGDPMATIKLTAIHNANGPDALGEIGAWLKDRAWPGGGTVKVLMLSVGRDTLEIWPADPERVRELGEKLIVLAKPQEAKIVTHPKQDDSWKEFESQMPHRFRQRAQIVTWTT